MTNTSKSATIDTSLALLGAFFYQRLDRETLTPALSGHVCLRRVVDDYH